MTNYVLISQSLDNMVNYVVCACALLIHVDKEEYIRL
jgi:hypothetical protein